MAKIVKFSRDNSCLRSRSKAVEVFCTYETGKLNDGSHCLILKTYNPKSITGGVSQVIHLTKETASELIDILKNEFKI